MVQGLLERYIFTSHDHMYMLGKDKLTGLGSLNNPSTVSLSMINSLDFELDFRFEFEFELGVDVDDLGDFNLKLTETDSPFAFPPFLDGVEVQDFKKWSRLIMVPTDLVSSLTPFSSLVFLMICSKLSSVKV